MKKRILQTLLVALFALFCVAATAQNRVSGTVTGDDGEPLPGVSIVIEGTNNGVVTNFNGSYNLQLPKSNVTLYSLLLVWKRKMFQSMDDL